MPGSPDDLRNDATAEELGQLLLSLMKDVEALNLKVATLHALLQEHVGVTDAQYAAAHARAQATVRALVPDGPPRSKH